MDKECADLSDAFCISTLPLQERDCRRVRSSCRYWLHVRKWQKPGRQASVVQYHTLFLQENHGHSPPHALRCTVSGSRLHTVRRELRRTVCGVCARERRAQRCTLFLSHACKSKGNNSAVISPAHCRHLGRRESAVKILRWSGSPEDDAPLRRNCVTIAAAS